MRHYIRLQINSRAVIRVSHMMKAHILILLVLIPCVFSVENTWKVTYNPLNLQESYTLQKDSATPSEAKITIVGSAETAESNTIEWLTTPTSVLVTALPSALTRIHQNITLDGYPGGASFQQLSAHTSYRIYRGVYNTSEPFYTIFGEAAITADKVFRCDRVTAGFTSFKCVYADIASGVGLAVSRFTFSFDVGSGTQTATVVIESDAQFPEGEVRDPMLAVAFIHLKGVAQGAVDAGVILEDNGDRQVTNQGVVGVLWWFWVMMMCCQIVVTALFQTWIWRGFDRLSDTNVTLVWICVLLVLLVIVMLSAGLFGWIVMGSIYGIYSLLLLCVYVLVRYRKTREAASEHGSDLELARVSPTASVSSGHGRPTPHSAIRLDDFTSVPQKLGKRQMRALIFTGSLYLVIAVFFFIVFFGAWTVAEYRIYNRFNGVEEEFAPQNVAKGSQSVYAFRRFATALQLDGFFEWATDYCGRLYTEELSASEKEARIKKEFIDKYRIDMSIFAKPDYQQYATVNEWFIRELRSPISSVRPLASVNETVMVSPADARLIAFERVLPDQSVWIKGEEFNIPELVGTVEGTIPVASMLIVRLAPQDYHRFHAPVSGVITAQYTISGNLHSVSADAMTSENYAIYNQRMVTVINSPVFGDVYFVAIGAVCVGSIQMTKAKGASVAKGDELGYFQFGGSTVAVVIPHDANQPRVRFDSDILARGSVKVETYARMGNQVGVLYSEDANFGLFFRTL